jgi:N-acetyl-beta-hexosaminidase
LAQQAVHEQLRLRPLEIEDAPRLTFRGLMLDMGRNFHPKSEVLASHGTDGGGQTQQAPSASGR